MLGTAFRPHSLFGTLCDPSQSSIASSIVKAAGALNDISNPRAPGPLSIALGIEPGWSAAKTASSIFGAGQLQGALVPEWWQNSFAVKGLQSALMPNGSANPFRIAAASPGWSATFLPKNHGLFEIMRGIDIIGSGIGDFMSRIAPVFDDLGSYLRGMADVIGRIDWTAVEIAMQVREARRPRTKIGFAALEAYDALHMNHPWVADEFLVNYLGIQKPNDDNREALWRVLRLAFERTIPRSARWIVLDDEQAARYLRKAIYKETKRVERDKERPNRVWWTARDPKTKKKIEFPSPVPQPEYNLELMAQRSENSENAAIGSMDPRVQVLEMLYFDGTEQDREIVKLLVAGFNLPGLAEVYGWPKVQAFMRKAQRWRRIKPIV